MNELIETWQIHSSMNTYLLSAIDDSHLGDKMANKGRNVGEQFAHIHNVRLMWLKEAAPELLENLQKIEKEAGITKAQLLTALQQSTTAITQLFEKAGREGKIKGFKPHPIAFLGYIISHESHHRGQMMLCLKNNGHLPDKKIQYGLWEWGKVK